MRNRVIVKRNLGFSVVASLTLLGPALAAPPTDPTVDSKGRAGVAQVSGPVAVTETSHPFLGAQTQMKAVGYVEEEYFLSGMAHTYDWDGGGHAVKPIAGPVPYVTRILVRRPHDPARFSGNIEVTVLNASLGVDVGGPTDFRRMVEQGDAWVGITTKALASNALKRFDPVRYAPLRWDNPAPPRARCEHPSIIPTYMIGGPEVMAAMAKAGMNPSSPESEDGLVWDMLGQLGLLLKSPEGQKLLPGAGSPRLYMTGVSQSAIYIRTWLAGFHDRFRTEDGRPVYDGYLGVVGPAMVRINQCADDVPLGDKRQKLAAPNVPFISISSEGEMWLARHTHQPDLFDARGGIVTYEVAGASHNAAEVPGLGRDSLIMAAPQDLEKSGVKLPNMGGGLSLLPPGSRLNDFVWAPAVRGAYASLQKWVAEGTRPPQAPGIVLDEKLEIRRDAHGNALGGLRMPYIEVPTASYTGYLSAGGIGGVMGARKPFSSELLKSLYPNHAAYMTRFSSASDGLVKQGLVSKDDGEAMKKAAEITPVPQ